MDAAEKSKTELLAEIQSLRDRLAMSEETLQAIQQGEVDALVVSTSQGDRIFTLQSADRSYRLLVEDMQQGAVTLSSEGLILSGNRSFATLLKQPLEKLIGSQFQQFISPSDRPLFQTLVQQAEKGERPASELLLIAQDATEISIYLAINHLNLGDSAINCLILTDLTEQKRYEKILASERLAHLILRQAGEAILVCDHTGQIIQASQVANQLLGGSLLYRSFDTVCPLSRVASGFLAKKQAGAIAETLPETAPLDRDWFSIASVLRGQQYQGLEVELDHPKGQYLNLVLNARPLNDEENHFKGAVVILTDITQRRQAEAALRQAKEELEFRVVERTQELQQANDRLQKELFRRERTERELQESASSLRSLYEVIAARHHSFEQRIQDLLAMGCQFFGLECGILARVQHGQYQVMVVRSPDQAMKTGDTVNVKQTLCCETLETDEPLTIEHVGDSQWRRHPAYSTFQVERYIGTRVLVGGEVHSTISFSSKVPSRDKFKPAHQELLKLMAQWIGIEIERLQAETESRQMSAALENAVSGISRLDAQGRYIAVNYAYAHPAGYEPREMLGMSWKTTIHPDDLENLSLAYQQMQREGKVEVEAKGIRKDGSVFYKQLVMIATYDEQHQFMGHHCFMKDISDRKTAEAALMESNRRWRSLLDNVQLAVVELDVNGKVKYANPFFLRLTEYSSEEALQQNWFSTFLVPSQKQAAADHFRQALVQNSHDHYQNSILTKSGKECIFAWNNTILRDSAGFPIGEVSIGEDITERYKVERMKAEFISVVSHELRTPLTSMQAALSLLSEKCIDPTSTEGEATIQIATEGTDRLVRLVNDILVLERLESGKVRLDKRPCNIHSLFNTAIIQMQEMAKQEGVTLLASPCTISVDADGDQLLQVLTNLLSNAIKFSPAGKMVWLTATVVEQEIKESEVRGAGENKFAISPPYLLFTIKDQGRGIPADSLERIFDRFHQVDASDSREKGGTGLGLAICRSIVQQHGGEIWVESAVNQGSTFYFTIPMAEKQNGKPNNEG